jgi:hypothetical protein
LQVGVGGVVLCCDSHFVSNFGYEVGDVYGTRLHLMLENVELLADSDGAGGDKASQPDSPTSNTAAVRSLQRQATTGLTGGKSFSASATFKRRMSTLAGHNSGTEETIAK